MYIVTQSCDACGTIVAGNVLEKYGRIQCPGPSCDEQFEFRDLSPEDQEHLIENSEKYRMD